MSVGQTVGLALLVSLTALLLRESKSALAPLLGLGGGILLLLSVLPRLSAFSSLFSLLSSVGLEEETVVVAKVLSVGFLTSMGADACVELGAPSVASKLELCGRVEILLLALPTLTAIVSGALSLLS